jgi:hypothetical protein
MQKTVIKYFLKARKLYARNILDFTMTLPILKHITLEKRKSTSCTILAWEFLIFSKLLAMAVLKQPTIT